jgi:hypothetical protein
MEEVGFMGSQIGANEMSLLSVLALQSTNDPVTIEPRSRSIAPLPRGIRPEVPQSYAACCERLGFAPGDLANVRLKEFLFDSGIALYDNVQVRDYLRGETLSSTDSIGWVPLREKDSPQKYVYKFRREGDPVFVGDGLTFYYQKLIPERVLIIVEQITNRFPDARFFVSEIQHNPDPFLGVSVDRNRTLHVVAVWDEPGFSGGKLAHRRRANVVRSPRCAVGCSSLRARSARRAAGPGAAVPRVPGAWVLPSLRA